MRLVLASASPRRAELLRAAGFTFDTVVVDVDERVHGAERAHDYVLRLASAKSAAAWPIVARPALQDVVVLGADTAVVVDGEILGKPRDDSEAASMLRLLAGRRHEVMTGISLRSEKGDRGLVEKTSVYMVDLHDAEVAWYVASGEGRDKAGAYGIQGLASRFIHRVEGSYSNVVGLPVEAVATLLRELASAG